jgi:hypothetical protein
MFFKYPLVSEIEIWLYYIAYKSGSYCPQQASLQSNFITLGFHGTLYNLYMYSTVLSITKFYFSFYEPSLYLSEQVFFRSYSSRKLICSLLITLILYILLFVAAFFEFSLFSLICSYLLYALRHIEHIKNAQSTEYLAWKVREYSRLTILRLFILLEENRLKRVFGELIKDVSCDFKYLYTVRSRTHEFLLVKFSSWSIELRADFDELKNYPLRLFIFAHLWGYIAYYIASCLLLGLNNLFAISVCHF